MISVDSPADDTLVLSKRLRHIRNWAIAGAIIWLAAVAGSSWWYTERVVSQYVIDVATDAQREAASTASIINRSFRELEAWRRFLRARQIYATRCRAMQKSLVRFPR